MSLDKPKQPGTVAQLWSLEKLRDKKTGEFLKIHKVNINRQSIQVVVEKHNPASVILRRIKTKETGELALEATLILRQDTGFQDVYSEPVPMGKDISVSNIFGQDILIHPLLVNETKEGVVVSFQIAPVSADIKTSFSVVPLGR